MPDQGIIKNRSVLASTPLRRQALDIIEAGIERVLPAAILRSALSFAPAASCLTIFDDRFELRGRIFVIGAGKASGLMAETLEMILGPGRIRDGIVVEKSAPADFSTRYIRIIQAGHPLPDHRGLKAAEEILNLKALHSIGKDDLVLCLISGGGSALLPSPLPGISLEDKQAVTALLISSGANINEINAVRKHLSATKGGRLAEYFAPARVISLILSDVLGNDLSVIASGPTSPDESTFNDAYSVLEKYHLLEKTPSSVISLLENGRAGLTVETPKTLHNAYNYVIGDLKMAIEAMAEKSGQLGFDSLIISATQRGETTAVAAQRAAEIKAGRYRGYNALLLGGETTPALPRPHGKGGRNQHYIACTMAELEGFSGQWVAVSIGTDGSDFIPEAAGAIADNLSLHFFKGREAEFKKGLENYNSYSILKSMGDALIVTGDTHTNVGDIILYLFDK